MTTYILTWNPKRWQWDNLREELAMLATNGTLPERWSCGGTRSIEPGDRFFLLRQGVAPRGIVGSGTVTSPPYKAPHWEETQKEAGHPALYVDVEFDSLRRLCLEHHKTTCSICGFASAAVYGADYADIIHVHHRVPLGEVDKAYRVDPVEDLRPVCPNCHAVIHSRRPALTIDEARQLLTTRDQSP